MSAVLGSVVLPAKYFAALALRSCFASLATNSVLISLALILFVSSYAPPAQHIRFLRHMLYCFMIMGSAETNPWKTKDASAEPRVTAHTFSYAPQSWNTLQVRESGPASDYFSSQNFLNEALFIIRHRFFFMYQPFTALCNQLQSAFVM